MKFNFQLKFDSLFEFSAPAYDDRQISYLLTEAQFRVFIKRYNPLGNKYQKGFEDDEQRRRDLEQLIRSATISGQDVTSAITYTGDITTGSAVVLNLSSTIGLNEGQDISAAGIPASTTIKSILSDSSVELSAVATATTVGVTITSGLGKSASQGQVHPNGIFLDLPDGFLYAVEEAVTLGIDSDDDGVIDGAINAKESWVKPVRHDEYLANINNPFKQPYKDLLWRMDISRVTHAEGTSVDATPKRTEMIHPDGYAIQKYRIRYLSLPPDIVVDEFDDTNQVHCILDQTLHREIVDEAVVIAQAAAQKEGYQIGMSEKQRSE
jgi:hypothetical protein